MTVTNLLRKSIGICATSFLLVVASHSVAKGRTKYQLGQNDGSKAVQSFKVEKISLLDALLQLGRERSLPLGIEYIDMKAVTEPITVEVKRATVAQVLDAILSQEPGYSWSFQNGVVHITHTGVPAGGMNLLDRVLQDFSIPRVSLTDADRMLRMTVYMDIHPESRGFAGDFPGPISNTQLDPLDMHDATVREVLNRIVREPRSGAAWVVQVSPEHLDELPPYGLWRVIEYEPHMPKYSSLISEILRRSQGTK